jgi:hypothetical protein
MNEIESTFVEPFYQKMMGLNALRSRGRSLGGPGRRQSNRHGVRGQLDAPDRALAAGRDGRVVQRDR